MTIGEAQREIRTRFVGGFYGQLVSGTVWLTSAALAGWRGPRAAIIMLVVGGFFIFPVTELLIRAIGERAAVTSANALRSLGMQIAFVLPLSMPLLVPVGLYRLNWFYPAMMILLGAHYLPFVFLYGMRMFAVLAVFLLGGGTLIAMYFSASFSTGAWYTGTVLLVFAVLGKMIVDREGHAASGDKAKLIR
jgi:MFS family permease